MAKFKIACVQIGNPTASKSANLSHAIAQVRAAAAKNAQLVLLPEYCCVRELPANANDRERILTTDAEVFGCDPDTDFDSYDVSTSPSDTLRQLSKVAKECNIWFFAGSYPERVEGQDRVYNTMPVFNPQGKLVATYRKVHLCDQPCMNSLESSAVAPGKDFVHVKTDYGIVGCAICYDIRFEAQARIAAKQGAILMLYPAYFPTRTGLLHWSVLQRSRALDNQFYVATCGKAKDDTIAWMPYGHSSVTDPSGQTMAELDGADDILYADIDTDYCEQVREELGVVGGKRHDLYAKYL